MAFDEDDVKSTGTLTSRLINFLAAFRFSQFHYCNGLVCSNKVHVQNNQRETYCS